MSRASITIIGNSWLSATIAFGMMISMPTHKVMLMNASESTHENLSDLRDTTLLMENHFVESNWNHAGKSKIIIFADEWTDIDTNPKGAREAMQSYKKSINLMKPHFDEETILFVASYPTEVFVKFILYWSGLKLNQVMGLGTVLDGVRLRRHLAKDYDVSSNNIPIYVYGKEKENALISWLSAPQDADTPPVFKKSHKESMRFFAMRMGQITPHQTEHKNFSQFGVSSCVISICNSIIKDEHRLRTVCFYQPDLDVCISVPAVVSVKGVSRYTLFEFDESDKDLLADAVTRIKEKIEEYKKLDT